MKPSQQRRIEAAYTPKRIDDRQLGRQLEIVAKLREAATLMCELCPDSRELNSALKSLEEAQFWALSSIFRE